jgi:methyl coenzyme M reductase gamma subunit
MEYHRRRNQRVEIPAMRAIPWKVVTSCGCVRYQRIDRVTSLLLLPRPNKRGRARMCRARGVDNSSLVGSI